MSALDLLASFLATLALHATVLLGAAWLLERAGALRHPGWAELAWRVALFGALLSAPLAMLSLPGVRDIVGDSVPASASAMQAAPGASNRTDGTAAGDAGSDARADAGTVDPARAATAADTQAAWPAAAAAAGATAPVSPASANPGNAAPAPQRIRASLPDIAVALAFLLWLAALALGGLRLAAQMLHLRRMAARARRAGEPAQASLQAASARLAGELGIAPPTLRLSPLARSPMVLPGATVLLPPWSGELAAPQQRALLAHELSHLQRHDPVWRIAQRLALLPLWFHPLAWHARARLEALAEDACDARAAQLMGSGLPLAECLATCLSHAGQRAGSPALAVAMAGAPGPVLRRVQNLLENTPMSLHPLSPRRRRSALVLGLALVVALPGLAVTTFATEAFADGLLAGVSHGLSGDRETYRFRSTTRGHRIDVTLTGKVGFNADETDIATLASGARFDYRETEDGVSRRYEVETDEGRLVRRYWHEGDEKPLDADGRAWLARTLPVLLRESGINAEPRARRILAEGGADALITELGHIKADYAARVYLAVLFADATLDDAQMQRALARAGRIESDFELRQALAAALAQRALTPARQVQVLGLAGGMDSDFERAELLAQMARIGDATPDVLAAWHKAVAATGSDFERRRVLDALLRDSGKQPAVVMLVLDSAAGMDSDFEARQVLERAAPHIGDDAARVQAYLQVTNGMGSDFEHRQALTALLAQGPVSIATADAVLESIRRGIGSDFEARESLADLARVMPNDPALIERYRAVTRRLGDFERGQAEKALDRFATTN